MMKEIPEGQETGALVGVYQDLRTFCRVPYVSSLQRHVATMPGCLEYAWAICRPGFASGRIPRTAWRLAQTVDDEAFPRLTRPALELMGVDDVGLAAIRNVCENFVRVAPINLLFAGLVERLLDGATPGNDIEPEDVWRPPPMLPSMPPMQPMEALDDAVRSVLMQVSTEIGGEPFVPGLYRLFAPWPAYLAHAATLIEPRVRSDAGRRSRRVIADRIVAAADGVLPHLAHAPHDLSPPDPAQAKAIISAIHTYRVTSPEMVVIGSLLLDALPAR